MTAVRFERLGDQYAITFAYTPSIVELIKTVPSFARSWRPAAKVWLVDAAWAPVLADTLRCYGHTVVGLDEPPPRRCNHGDADWARMLFRRVGPGRASLAYKLLSRLCHPDHGGDHQLQIELNAAHAEISRRKDDPAA